MSARLLMGFIKWNRKILGVQNKLGLSKYRQPLFRFIEAINKQPFSI